MQNNRWVRAGLAVSAAALVGAMAVAPAAEAVQGKFYINKSYWDMSHSADTEGLQVSYRLPDGKPVAEPVNEKVSAARAAAMARTAALYKDGIAALVNPVVDANGEYPQCQAVMRALEDYEEVVDAAEIAYAATLEEAASEHFLAANIRNSIGCHSDGTVEHAQRLAYLMTVIAHHHGGDQAVGDLYIAAVNPQQSATGR